jgi:hypothetical protein
MDLQLPLPRGGEDYRRREGGGGEVPEFLGAKSLKPFISEDLLVAVSSPFIYQSEPTPRIGLKLSFCRAFELQKGIATRRSALSRECPQTVRPSKLLAEILL